MVKRIALLLAFLALFGLIFGYLQSILQPKYVSDSTSFVEGYYALEQNSLDILFLGSSKMFCSIIPNQLATSYGWSAYDFGSSSQRLIATELYLREALKTQHPKVVCLEMSMLFSELEGSMESDIAFSYVPLRFSVDKVLSLARLFHNSIGPTLSYSFPLIQFHNRWDQLSSTDFTYPLEAHPHADRGYFFREESEPIEMVYFNSSETDEAISISEQNIIAIKNIKEICEKNNIKLIAFSAPDGFTTKSMQMQRISYCEDNAIDYINCYLYWDNLAIDIQKDFFNTGHLNNSGATKFTAFIGEYIDGMYHDLLTH